MKTTASLCLGVLALALALVGCAQPAARLKPRLPLRRRSDRSAAPTPQPPTAVPPTSAPAQPTQAAPLRRNRRRPRRNRQRACRVGSYAPGRWRDRRR
jgi:hypothetical protein